MYIQLTHMCSLQAKFFGNAKLTMSISDYQAIYNVKRSWWSCFENSIFIHILEKIYFKVFCLRTIITCSKYSYNFFKMCCVFIHVVCGGCHSAVYRCEGQRTVWEWRFSSSVMWVPPASIRASGLAAVVFIWWPVLWQSIYITFTWGLLYH